MYIYVLAKAVFKLFGQEVRIQLVKEVRELGS